MSISGGTDKTRLFDMTDFCTPAKQEDKEIRNAYLSNSSLSPVNGLSVGWNGFELEISYNELEDSFITIGGYNKQISKVTLNGNFESESEGVITSTSQIQNFGKLAGVLATAGGAPALKLVKKIGDNPNIHLGSTIKDAIKELNKGDIASALKAGLNMIFGKSTVVNEQQLRFSTKGTVTLGGTIETSLVSGVSPLAGINLKQIINSATNTNNDNSIVPNNIVTSTNTFDLKDLGVWNVQYSPILTMSRYSRLIDGVKQYLYPPDRVLPIDYKVIFNPSISKFIKNHSFSSKIVIIDRLGNEEFQPINPIVSPIGAPSDRMWNEKIFDDGSLIIKDGNILPFTPFMSNLFDPVEGNYDYFYDWGGFEDKYVLLVTVEMTFEYYGKTQNIISSRYYRANVVNNPVADQRILKSGRYRNPYIIDRIYL